MTERVADLAVLLVDHPLTGSTPLLHSRDVSVSAGEARRAAHAIADELGSLGV